MENSTSDGNFKDSNERKFNRKRSKKSRFASNAKGFGKKGIYGRGTHIEESEFTYFVNLLSAMKDSAETTEEKVTLSNNVSEQTIDKEIHLSSNQVVSKVIESIIAYMNEEHFERFLKKFSEDLRPLCSNKFASHVLQKLIEISFLRSVEQKISKEIIKNTKTDDSDDTINEPKHKKLKISVNEESLDEKQYNLRTKFQPEHRKICEEFVLKMGKFLLNNLEDFLWDPYTNPLMRTTIMSLSGIHLQKTERTTINPKDWDEPYEVKDEWKNIVKEYGNRLMLWPQFSELPYDEMPSIFFEYLCIALKAIDKNSLKHFGKKLLMESFLKVDGENDDKKEDKIEIKDDDDEEVDGDGDKTCQNKIQLPRVFQQASSTRLLEILLRVAGKKLFTQIYAMLFVGRLKQLAINCTTNFAVQRLIEKISDKSDFEAIFNELVNDFEDILREGCTGVIYILSNGCLKFQTKQSAFVNALQNALHTNDKDNKDKQKNAFFICLLKLKPYEFAINDKSLSYHGILIIQNILCFNKPINLINCILNTETNKLLEIFSDRSGSYIVEKFMESKFVGEKSREKLLKLFDGFYVDLAIGKFSSHVLESLFNYSNDNQKMKIAKELCEKLNQLNSTMFGRIIYKKLRLQTYCLSPTQWKASLNKINKTEKLFEDIIK